jgi:hypothetical protein
MLGLLRQRWKGQSEQGAEQQFLHGNLLEMKGAGLAPAPSVYCDAPADAS